MVPEVGGTYEGGGNSEEDSGAGRVQSDSEEALTVVRSNIIKGNLSRCFILIPLRFGQRLQHHFQIWSHLINPGSTF